MTGPLIAVCAISLLLGGLITWLLLRPKGDDVIKRVDAELDKQKAELERDEASKTGDEVWRTFEDITE